MSSASLQDFAAAAIVVAALAYLVWKIGFGGRRPPRKGPDVSLAKVRDRARKKRRREHC